MTKLTRSPAKDCVVPCALALVALATLILAERLCAEDKPAKPDSERIDRLIQQLGGEDFQERERAEKDLVALGSVALPKLEAVVKSPDRELARRARRAAAEINRLVSEACSASQPRIPDRQELDDPNPYARLKAVQGLLRLQSLPPEAKPLFAKALNDPDDEVRIAGLIGSTRMMDRKAALRKLRAVIWDEKESPRVRQFMVFQLSRFKPEAGQVVPDLLRLLKAPDPKPRMAAAAVLGELGRGRPEVISALLDALSDPHHSVRGNAAAALGQLRQEPRRCVPAIHQMLQRQMRRREKETHALAGILEGLSNFGPNAKESIPTVFALAKDDSADQIVRIQAIACLEAIGPSALKQLEQLTAVEDPVVSSRARFAFNHMPAAERKQKVP